MLRKKAIEVFFKVSEKSNETISDLMAWNPRKTVRENAEKLEISKESAKSLATRYDLKFKRVYDKRLPK